MLRADVPGYIVIYINNNSIGKDVYFDDIKIEHYNGNVLEESHYYPFGLTVSQMASGATAPENPYKYNTKELETAFGLQSYDYGARMYNSQIGRWDGIDPVAEKFTYESPYIYAGNNPAKNIDIGGMFKVDKETARNYPIVEVMANGYFPLLVDNSNIKKAFLENMEGEMTGKQFDEMVKRNSGPTIVVAPEDGTSEYNPAYPDKIFISKKLLMETQDAFEKAQKNRRWQRIIGENV